MGCSKKLCICSILILIIAFLCCGKQYSHEKSYESYVQFINQNWGTELIEADKELYYNSEFVWKGEGFRYYVFNYSSTNQKEYLENHNMQKIQNEMLFMILDELYPHYESLEDELKNYLPNSKTEEQYYYCKVQADNDQLHMFLCQNSTLDGIEYEYLLFVFEVLY